MLGPFLGVCHQVADQSCVGYGLGATRPGAGNRTHLHLSVTYPHQPFRRGADDGMSALPDEPCKRGRISSAQTAVKLCCRCLRIKFPLPEAREIGLEDITIVNIAPCSGNDVKITPWFFLSQ